MVDTVNTDSLQNTSSSTKESEEGESESVLELCCQTDASLVKTNQISVYCLSRVLDGLEIKLLNGLQCFYNIIL